MVAAQARGRAAGQIPYATDLTAGTTWGRDQHGASLDPTRTHFRRNELTITFCQWTGMTVDPSRCDGKCICGNDLDPCSHHL